MSFGAICFVITVTFLPLALWYAVANSIDNICVEETGSSFVIGISLLVGSMMIAKAIERKTKP